MEQESRGWRWERGERRGAPGCTPGSNRSTRPSLCPSTRALDGPFGAPRSLHPHPPPHKAPTGPKGVPGSRRWEAAGRSTLPGVGGGPGPGPGGSRSVTAPRGEGPYREAGPARPDPPRSGNGHREEVHGRWGRSSTAPRRTVPVPGAGSRVPGSRVPGSRVPVSRFLLPVPVPHPGCTGSAERTQL